MAFCKFVTSWDGIWRLAAETRGREPSRVNAEQLLCRSAGSYLILCIGVRSVNALSSEVSHRAISRAATLTKSLILLIL
jgi:hypothetical protein